MTLRIRRFAFATIAAAVLAFLLFQQLGADGSGDLSTTALDQTNEQAPVETEVLSAKVIWQDEAPDSLQENNSDNKTLVTPSLQAGNGFTGDAEVDLPSTDPDVIVIPDLVGGVQQRDVPVPAVAPVPTYDLGWDIKDLRVKYVADSDELIIAMNSYGVVGDPEGNGDPALFDQRWITAGAGGTDVPELGPNEGVTFVLDLDLDGTYDVVAGTNYANSLSQFGLFEFEEFGLFAPLSPTGYGAPVGALSVQPASPSLAAPDLIFTIANFSTLPGNDGSLSFGINAMAGSRADGAIGEDTLDDFNAAKPVFLDAEIGDFVWSDSNADGIQDDGEPGVAGLPVNLLDANGNVVDSTTTDGAGEYLFIVTPGSYMVEFVVPAGDKITSQHAGENDDKDSNADPLTGRSAVVTLGANGSNYTIDAGIILFVAAPSIDIEKSTNGLDADDATGPELEVGTTATFTYVVRNTGNVPLDNVRVTDDKLGDITCPSTILPTDGSMECIATATVAVGQYRNVGTVVGTPTGPNADGAGSVTANDPSHYFGFVPFQPAPGITLEKLTDGEDADVGTGPELIVGEMATFTYVADNTGNVDLIDVTVTDDVLGEICIVDRIIPNGRAICEATALVTEGQYVNVGTVTATGVLPNGDPLPEPVTDEDSSHHVGIVPGPACATTMHGPRMYHTSTVVDETGLVAEAGSKIYIITSEPGASPDQPNEQVYIQVGDDMYGPTPAGLGELEFTVANTGPVTILHYSVVSGDTSMPNSVEYDWCGTNLEPQ